MERLPVMSDACAVCGLGTVVARVRRTTHVVAESPAMQAVLVRARDFADADAPVVILGESGTGKEVVARALHASSARGARAFVAVNVAALPAELLESELFGHVKGAFTGATAEKQGLLEAAHGGTLFLDEIGEMPLPLQAKLLRALEDGEVRRVGDTRAFGVDVRFVCATHQDLARLVAEGRFREDLYYRLNVVPIQLPALRERPGDVDELARAFLERMAPRIGRKVTSFAPEALELLRRHPWPGNVRELENVVEQALVFADGDAVRPQDLPEGIRHAPAPAGLPVPSGDRSLTDILEDLEQQLILAAYEKAKGVKAETARLLGIKPSALYYKLEKYGIVKQGERGEEGG
jgi:two-component system response regulator HydG